MPWTVALPSAVSGGIISSLAFLLCDSTLGSTCTEDISEMDKINDLGELFSGRVRYPPECVFGMITFSNLHRGWWWWSINMREQNSSQQWVVLFLTQVLNLLPN